MTFVMIVTPTVQKSTNYAKNVSKNSGQKLYNNGLKLNK